MRIAFTKMHGLGNDFAIFDAHTDESLLSPERLRALADRRTGIGFDQALLLAPPQRAGSLTSYRIFNRDGDEVEQCGNGARCIAALLHRRGLTGTDGMALDSPVGVVQARIDGGGEVAVDMGLPNFDPRALPFDSERASDPYPLQIEGERLQIGAVSMGNPHAVLQVADAAQAPVARLGPQIERHPRFPKGVNVGFMQLLAPDHIRLRVYERGAGETRACGTGACAAVAIGRRRGLLASRVRVSVQGGELRVDWAGEPAHVWLAGPAQVSFEGHLEV